MPDSSKVGITLPHMPDTPRSAVKNASVFWGSGSRFAQAFQWVSTYLASVSHPFCGFCPCQWGEGGGGRGAGLLNLPDFPVAPPGPIVVVVLFL